MKKMDKKEMPKKDGMKKEMPMKKGSKKDCK